MNTMDETEKYIDVLNKCGIYITEINIAEKDIIVQTIAMQHVILHCKAELDQLIEGLKALQVHSTICAHSELFEETFTNNVKDPSAGITP